MRRVQDQAVTKVDPDVVDVRASAAAEEHEIAAVLRQVRPLRAGVVPMAILP